MIPGPEGPMSPSDIWRFPVQDFLVLARPDVSGLYILNPSARLIWDTFRAGVPRLELVREYVSAYDVPDDVAARDVAQTLDQWRRGLLSNQRKVFHDASIENALSSPGPDSFVRDYVVHGKSVRVVLETLELALEIAPRLAPLHSAPFPPHFIFRVSENPDGFRIFCDDAFLAYEESLSAARAVLLQEIVRCCRGGRESLAIFHAGACGSSNQCVIFPGVTHSGKTTLAAVLMEMGLLFYGDDSVILERDTLRVPAMPFALSIREGSWNILHSRIPNLRDAPVVSRYGQQVRFLAPILPDEPMAAAQPTAIIFAQFDPNGGNQTSALDKIQTLLRLQESGFWVAHDEQSIHAFLAWIQSTPSFTLTYSDVDQAAVTIHRLIG